MGDASGWERDPERLQDLEHQKLAMTLEELEALVKRTLTVAS